MLRQSERQKEDAFSRIALKNTRAMNNNSFIINIASTLGAPTRCAGKRWDSCQTVNPYASRRKPGMHANSQAASWAGVAWISPRNHSSVQLIEPYE